jgi:small conductance mechanosensitive channel
MITDFLLMTAATGIETVSDSIASSADIYQKAITSISGMTISEIISIMASYIISFGIKILKVILIWFVGRWLAKRLRALIKIIMERHNTAPSVQTFLSSLVDVVIMITLIIMIIGVLGIDTSSFIALFASAGVAVGMALSGTLQNFAGGVIILLFRPYKVGDYIEAQGQAGTVKEIQIFNTILKTPDNKIILVPNGPISTGIINNYSRESLRRVDFTVSISYGNDYEKAKEVISAIIDADSRILRDPAPFIALKALNSSSIDIAVRVWAKQEDYWDIYFDMNKTIYETLPKHGLEFPFQTLTVNVTK